MLSAIGFPLSQNANPMESDDTSTYKAHYNIMCNKCETLFIIFIITNNILLCLQKKTNMRGTNQDRDTFRIYDGKNKDAYLVSPNVNRSKC